MWVTTRMKKVALPAKSALETRYPVPFWGGAIACRRKSAVQTLLNHDVFPPLAVRLRSPANSRTLQLGSLSFTDCGCIVGYINVANATAGLTTRRPTLEVGGCFHERNLFGSANELSDWIGILFFRKVCHESFTVRISELYMVTSEDCCIFWRQAVPATQVFMRDTKLFCERRSISNLPVSRGNCNAIHRRMVARVDLSESTCPRQIDIAKNTKGSLSPQAN
jgi:hypothetical protein